jgi:gliding motility-associated-like protein
MVINASFTPGDFYVDTIAGLCENSTYEFSAWVVNILRSSACGGNAIKPNLTFKIETTRGTVLGKYETGTIAQLTSPQWKQYGLFFKTPPGVNSVVVRITNNAPGGCGNDLALDDISFRPCGPTVSATTLLATGATTNLDICDTDGNDYNLSATISAGYSNPAYQWQVSINDGEWKDIPGAESPAFNRKRTAKGIYRYRITVAEVGNIGKSSCRVVSNTITVNVNEKPAINVKSNSPLCEGEVLQLQSNAAGKITWTGPNGFTANSNPQLKATPAITGKYIVTAVSDAGCINVDSTVVVVKSKPVARASGDKTICEGSSAMLNASGGKSYQWSPVTGVSGVNTATPTASPTETTKYIVTVRDEQGCDDTASVTIQINKKPVAHAGPDKKMNEGQTVTLNGAVEGKDLKYFWTPVTAFANANTLTPVVSPAGDITYTLHAVSNAGCGEGTDNVFVRVFKKINIPNAFSPNGDGINDCWQITALETYPEATITIFNRYGQQVYVSNGYSKPWDGKQNGKALPVGSYYYVIDLHNQLPVVTGWIMILR